MKREILTEIINKLLSLGIKIKTEDESDIVINTEFLDAGWSTGSKRIVYEATVFVNEDENTVYMFEKTIETGAGLLASSVSTTSFQSGRTLFRKVKSVGYGLDGKAFEYTFDLGEIPKAVKETAKEYSWKFKTVLNRKKACYPQGYLPSIILPSMDNASYCKEYGKSCNTNTDKQYDASYIDDTPITEPVQKKKSAKGSIGFILIAAISILMHLLLKVSLAGWISSSAIFLLGYVTYRKSAGRGCFVSIIIWIIAAVLLLLSGFIFSEGEINYTTANIKNAVMTTSVDADGKPLDEVTSYDTEAARFIISAELHNAPQHTKITFVWTYVSEDMIITDFELDSGENEPDIYIYSFLTNDSTCLIGDYTVEIYVEDREKPDQIVEFRVK